MVLSWICSLLVVCLSVVGPHIPQAVFRVTMSPGVANLEPLLLLLLPPESWWQSRDFTMVVTWVHSDLCHMRSWGREYGSVLECVPRNCLEAFKDVLLSKSFSFPPCLLFSTPESNSFLNETCCKFELNTYHIKKEMFTLSLGEHKQKWQN